MPYTNYPYNFYNNYPQPSSQFPSIEKNNICWVQGVEGAKAMQIPVGGTKLLMDSENEGVFYIKTSDNIGICSLRTFMYEEVTNNNPVQSEYVTKNEFQKIVKELEELKVGLKNE